MIDFIAKLISGGNSFNTILLVVVGYIGLLWFLFSFWVYVDAKKRYKRSLVAVLFFLVVLIFNFPALVFYLITRPEDESNFIDIDTDNSSNRGVNVPIVNFVGADGKVSFSFELKINNSSLAVTPDMTVDVNWKSEKREFKVEESQIEVLPEVMTPTVEKVARFDKFNKARNNIRNNAYASIRNVKSKVSNLKPKFNLPKKKEEKVAEVEKNS